MCPPPYVTKIFEIGLVNDLDWVLGGKWGTLDIVVCYMHRSYWSTHRDDILEYDPIHVVFWASLPKITVNIVPSTVRPVPTKRINRWNELVGNYTRGADVGKLILGERDMVVEIFFPFGFNFSWNQEFSIRVGKFI